MSHFSPALKAGLQYDTVTMESQYSLYHSEAAYSFILLATRSRAQQQQPSTGPDAPLADFKVHCGVSNEDVDTCNGQVLPLVRTLFTLPIVCTGLRTLRVSYGFLFDEADSWREVFGTVASVTTLEVHGRCAMVFLAVSTDHEPAMLFPYLRHLSIDSGKEAFRIPDGRPLSFAANLKAWAEARKASGSALRQITLKKCEVQSWAVDELSEALGGSITVDWDGHEGLNSGLVNFD